MISTTITMTINKFQNKIVQCKVPNWTTLTETSPGVGSSQIEIQQKIQHMVSQPFDVLC